MIKIMDNEEDTDVFKHLTIQSAPTLSWVLTNCGFVALLITPIIFHIGCETLWFNYDVSQNVIKTVIVIYVISYLLFAVSPFLIFNLGGLKFKYRWWIDRHRKMGYSDIFGVETKGFSIFSKPIRKIEVHFVNISSLALIRYKHESAANKYKIMFIGDDGFSSFGCMDGAFGIVDALRIRDKLEDFFGMNNGMISIDNKNN